MKASRNVVKAKESKDLAALHELPSGRAPGSEDGIDISLLEDSLTKTPWERMQANDDALRFADSLRTALEKRNAKPERTDPQID